MKQGSYYIYYNKNNIIIFVEISKLIIKYITLKGLTKNEKYYIYQDNEKYFSLFYTMEYFIGNSE